MGDAGSAAGNQCSKQADGPTGTAALGQAGSNPAHSAEGNSAVALLCSAKMNEWAGQKWVGWGRGETNKKGGPARAASGARAGGLGGMPSCCASPPSCWLHARLPGRQSLERMGGGQDGCGVAAWAARPGWATGPGGGVTGGARGRCQLSGPAPAQRVPAQMMVPSGMLESLITTTTPSRITHPCSSVLNDSCGQRQRGGAGREARGRHGAGGRCRVQVQEEGLH